jgi:lipoprotein LprG
LHLLAVWSVLALAGCGGAAREQATPLPTPTPTELLELASQRLAETPAVHFVLEVEGDAFVDPLAEMLLVRAEGDLQRPDRVRTALQLEVIGRIISLSLVSVGDRAWMTDLLTGEWGVAPIEFTYRPGIIFSAQNGLGPMMEHVQDVEALADEKIAGRQAYHVRASVPQDAVIALTNYTIKGSLLNVDFWIDHETQALLRVRIAEQPAPDRPHPAIWTIDFSHHGEPITIDPPVQD